MGFLEFLWAALRLVALLGVIMAVMSTADLVVDGLIRVFPGIGEWLDHLPLSK